MSLEQNVEAVVQAANNLAGVVSEKIGQIDARMDQARAQFDDYRNKKDMIGLAGEQGTLLMNVFQGGVWGTGGVYNVGSSGGFSLTDLGASTNVYMHFKLPLNINKHDCMFWFNIRGYSYGSAAIIDETIVGYCYSPNRQVMNQAVFGNMTPAIYTDTVGNVVMRLKFPNIYVTTIRIDTMQAGVGAMAKVGDIVAKVSLTEKVEF